MKDYKRLTERGEPYYGFEKCKTCEYGKDGCDKWCDQITGCFCRLQELEDKIESGELCNREEVRKETAREILKSMLNKMYKLTGCGVPYHVKKFMEEIANEYGIDLEDEE